MASITLMKNLEKKFKIGFIKLGLKTYFIEDKESCQGSNYELVNVFNIFKERGHDCRMISKSDIGNEPNFVPDIYFVFNGPTTTIRNENMIMFKNYLFPYFDILNATKIPYAYFRTDGRKQYDLLNNPLIRKPDYMLTQEPNNYAHLDKLVLYKKEIRTITKKTKKFAVLMNLTEPKRSKNAVIACHNLKKYKPIIIGNWKKKLNEFLTPAIQTKNVGPVLDTIKYSWNQTANKNWTSPKFWEMILSNVICFHFNSDLNKLVIPDWLRIKTTEEMLNTIKNLEKKPEVYKEYLTKQQDLILPEYFTGDFIYQTIINKVTHPIKEM